MAPPSGFTQTTRDSRNRRAAQSAGAQQRVTGDAMLSVSDLSRPGLDPVSFELDAGECLVVRGPSGAGKTLLLRAIADLDLKRRAGPAMAASGHLSGGRVRVVGRACRRPFS
jgi:ABC-type multidrug transport system ATPase subunit